MIRVLLCEDLVLNPDREEREFLIRDLDRLNLKLRYTTRGESGDIAVEFEDSQAREAMMFKLKWSGV